MANLFTPGRIIVTFCNLLYSIGAYVADWNETHVKNPNWPPHARFHNGQTMSLGACLATASIYFALAPALTKTSFSAKEGMLYATVIGTFYSGAGLSAILYPGTAWVDPEFDMPPANAYLFMSIVTLMWVGYFLESSRLSKTKTT